MRSKLLFIFLCISPFLLISQELDTINTESMLALTTKNYGDNITLRWAPTSAENWFYGMQYGYSISRRDISDPESRYEMVIDTIRPWAEQRIMDYIVANPDDKEMILPYQAIYQDWENTTYKNTGWAEALEKSSFFDQRYQMVMLGSDLYPIIAEASGLKYVDESIESDKLYSYMVNLNYQGDFTPWPAVSVAKKWKILDQPIILEAVEKENAIAITWDKELHASVYTAYYVERSEDGKTFERLTEKPYLFATGPEFDRQPFIVYNDQVENYKPYHYRLIGIDAFGDLSEPSGVVVAKGKDRTPPEVTKVEVNISEDGNSNMITWTHDPIKELSQVVIYKEDSDKETKVVYNATTDTQFDYNIEDTEVVDGMSDYYIVLVDTAGNYASSVKTSLYKKDMTPPSSPLGLSSEIDTSGTVTLTWDEAVDNDVIGYFVYTADKKNNNYIKLNQKKHRARQFVDSINMSLLTEKRFYKVVAMDKGGNLSEYSLPLEVTLPDKIPPAPCLFYDYKVDSVGVFLGLMPSSSRDVTKYRIYRSEQGKGNWKILEEFGNKPPQVFLDRKVESAGKYTYKWIAVDEAGLESSDEHSKLNITAFDQRMFFSPVLRLTKVDEGIKIEAGKNTPGKDYRIQIIRSHKGRKYRTLTTLKGATEYLDKMKFEEGEKIDMKYRAKILYKDGKRSKFGKEVSM